MPLYRLVTAFVDVIITLITAILGLRVILMLFGANADQFLVKGFYAISEPLVTPFAGIFPALTLESGFVLEFATLFALIVYAVLAHIILTLIRAAAFAAFRRRHMPRSVQAA